MVAATDATSRLTEDQAGSLDFAHTAPGTLAGRYLRTFWQPVHVAENLLPGWAKPIRVMSEDFTLYRGESGQVHLIGFRCAHRGTQLSTGWVEGDCVRCLYHGWKYDGTGECVEQPGEAQPFSHTVKIPSYPTQEYLGLIFAYFGPGAPPPLPRYPDFESGGVRLTGTRIRRCNYFNDVENSTDLFHVAWAHREARGRQPMHSLEYVPGSLSACESDWGVTAAVRLTNGSVRTNQFGMPTMLNFQAGNEAFELGGTEPTDVVLWRVPLTDDEHHNFIVRRVHVPEEKAEQFLENRRNLLAKPRIPANDMAEIVLRGDVRIQDPDAKANILPWEIVNVQDDVTQVGQGIIADRTNERRGATDVGVVLLRQIWEREMHAFAQGRPLKQWNRTKALLPTWGL